MKKLIFSLLGVFMIASYGCGGQSVGNKKSNSDAMQSGELEAKQEVKGVIQLTKQGFLNNVMNYEENPQKWVFRGDKPCLIDFYADWCAPCRISSPILEELAMEYHGKIQIYKVDTEVERELAAIFRIQSIPSFLFCPMEGNPVMSAGIAPTPEETKQMFRERIDEFLLKNEL
jgi:thioredoxin 1